MSEQIKVIFATNLPSPYRVDFFNELGKHCNLTVVYERKTSALRSDKWISDSAQTYKEVYLDTKPIGEDKSVGFALANFVSKNEADFLIFSNYFSPSVIVAIWTCNLRSIPYIIEYDGGFNVDESWSKMFVKRQILTRAKAHLTTSDQHIAFLKKLGINRKNIYKYPFTSLRASDILTKGEIVPEKKMEIKEKLGIKAKRVVTFVGRMLPVKGVDIWLSQLNEVKCTDVVFYFIGGEATEEYKQIIRENKLQNIVFVPHLGKTELWEYLRITDIFVLPTRKDVWGLVVNESLSCGVPVVSTDNCIAALEIIENGVNGYCVESDILGETVNYLLNNEELLTSMPENCLNSISPYTIENMAKTHMNIFKEIINSKA